MSAPRTPSSAPKSVTATMMKKPESYTALPWIFGVTVVREIALSFPEVTGAASGRVAYSVRGKGFAWEARERDGGGLAVRVDGDEKQLFLDASPEAYFTSPHYRGYPAAQMRLESVSDDELRERLAAAWLIQAPRQLAAAYMSDSG